MKIMFNTSSMGKGGAERVISILANALVNKNEISILVNIDNEIAYTLDNRIKIIKLDCKRVKSNLIRNIKRIKMSESIIKKEKPDIIISFLPIPSYRMLFLKKKFPNIKQIVADRNDPKQEYKSIIDRFLMKKLYKRADGFVFQTNQQKNYFSKGIQKKSVIIYNPIKNEFLNKNILKKEKIIINVGRLVDQKNQEMLIDAFSEVQKQNSNYKLKIFGDGPLKEKLKIKINELKINDSVELCGISNDIKNELEKSEIFVLTSNYEGMPNALIEAMALGMPVISTDCDCGGPKELIKNNVNGVLIPVDDRKALIGAINRIISEKDFAREIGKNAEKIKNNLKIENIVMEWENFIKYIIEGNK